MSDGIEQFYKVFKGTLLEAIAADAAYLKEIFVLDDVLKNAAERFLTIATINRWDSTEVQRYLLPYVMRTKCGLDRVMDEEDSWVGLYCEGGNKRPTVFESPTLFLHDVIHWREQTKFVNRGILLDFLSDYPYILSGRGKVTEDESRNIDDTFLLRGLLSDSFRCNKPMVGEHTAEKVQYELSNRLRD